MTRFVLFVALLVPSIASAQYRGDVPLGDTLTFTFNTVGSTGAPITIAGTPAIEVYEEGSITQITAGTTLTEDFDGVTGLHNVAIVATGANGYEAGKWYDVVIAGTTPTADSVSILGRTLGSFRVVVAENVSGTPAVDVELIEGTAASSSLASAADIVNEWETQSQADPTGFHVNVLEVGGTAQTANDNGADINAILADTGTDGVVLANDAITAAKVAADAIGSSELEATAVAEIWNATLATYSATAGSVAEKISKIVEVGTQYRYTNQDDGATPAAADDVTITVP